MDEMCLANEHTAHHFINILVYQSYKTQYIYIYKHTNVQKLYFTFSMNIIYRFESKVWCEA